MISPTIGNVTVSQAIDRIAQYMDNPDNEYTIMIGTESQVYDNYICYVTVLAVHNVGHGGIYFYNKEMVEERCSLVNRLYTEASKSLEFASTFMDEIRNHHLEKLINTKNIEIHVDIGNNGNSCAAIAGAVGMIKGYGYNVKIKPDAYAASAIADKKTKNPGKSRRKLRRQLKKAAQANK